MLCGFACETGCGFGNECWSGSWHGFVSLILQGYLCSFCHPQIHARRHARSPHTNPFANPFATPRTSPRTFPRTFPLTDPRTDPRTNARTDPRTDPRADPRADPCTGAGRDRPKQTDRQELLKHARTHTKNACTHRRSKTPRVVLGLINLTHLVCVMCKGLRVSPPLCGL